VRLVANPFDGEINDTYSCVIAWLTS